MDAISTFCTLVLDRLQEARPRDVVWGLFAFNALLISWTLFVSNRILQRRHERRLRANKIDNRHCRAVLFDLTGSTLRSQPLPKFSLEDWDESLRVLVRDWNKELRKSDIIVPENKEDADALGDLIHTEASELLIRCLSGIRGFLQDDQIISEEDGFKHVRFLVSLARPPKESIEWFDAARLVITPIRSARQIASVSSVDVIPTRLSPKNHKTWSSIIRQMGLLYLRDQKRNGSRKFNGLAIVDIALDH